MTWRFIGFFSFYLSPKIIKKRPAEAGLLNKGVLSEGS